MKHKLYKVFVVIALFLSCTAYAVAGFSGTASAAMSASSAPACEQAGWKHLKLYDPKNPDMVDEHVCCPPTTENDATSCLVGKYINPIVKLLSVAAGIAVVIGVIMGGVQYSASAGDPQKAAQAKGRITKALFGLIAFLFLYSALQFFSPGGISTTPVPDTTKSGTIATQCSKEFLGLKPWFAYLPNSAFQSGTCNIQNFSLLGDGSTPSQILPIFLVVADDLVRIAGLVAVAFVITGGIQLVTSQAEPDKTKRARETIISALVGVAVAIVAASVVAYIGSRLSS